MIVLDASFIAKLILEEEGSEDARRLTRSWIMGGEILVAPDIALAETLNVLWKHTYKIKDIDEAAAFRGVSALLMLWSKIKVYQSSSLAVEAFKLAGSENIPVYDAIYLQLAISTSSSIATFDEKLKEVALRRGVRVYP